MWKKYIHIPEHHSKKKLNLHEFNYRLTIKGVHDEIATLWNCSNFLTILPNNLKLAVKILLPIGKTCNFYEGLGDTSFRVTVERTTCSLKIFVQPQISNQWLCNGIRRSSLLLVNRAKRMRLANIRLFYIVQSIKNHSLKFWLILT